MGYISKLFYCVGVLSLAMTAWVVKAVNNEKDWSFLLACKYACLGIVSSVCAAICLDIARLSPADSHTPISLISQYIFVNIFSILLIPRYRRFMKSTKNIKMTQEKVLMEFLGKNGSTAYGQDHGLNGITSREDFVEMHPLTEYSHYEKYIERLCEGETGLMTQYPILCFGLSSGTTGKSKKIPLTKDYRKFAWVFFRLFGNLVPDLKRIGALRVKPKTKNAKCGIPIDTLSHYFASKIPYNTIPRDASEIENEQVALYLGALFCLKERELSVLETMMSTLAYAFFKVIENNMEALCNDIEHGTISDHIDLDENVRQSLTKRLRPDAKRALEVQKEFSLGNMGLAKRLWPHLALVTIISSGGLSAPFKYLKETYLKGAFCKGLYHGATEGTTGFVFDSKEDMPDEPTIYTLIADLYFYEFIPEEDIGKPEQTTFFADQVFLDRNYEVVITNPFGLYRYRTGDVIKIVDFCNQCPMYEFQYRTGQLLNLVYEKTPESVLYRAISMAGEEWGGAIIQEYTATESVCLEGCDIELNDKCYVLFMEVNKKGANYLLTDEQKEMIDHKLCEIFPIYDSLRKQKSIGEIKAIQVVPGTFIKVREMLNKDIQNPQFKTPRAIRKPEVLALLLQSNISSPVMDE